MKNEALEDLWRLLNIADIEAKGLAPSVVKEMLASLGDVLNEACVPEDDEFHAWFVEGYEYGWEDRKAGKDYDPHFHI